MVWQSIIRDLHEIFAVVMAFCILTSLPLSCIMADPDGVTVETGQAAFNPNDTGGWDITADNGTVINWQNLNINQGQTYNYILPDSASSVLNRSGNLITINGAVNSIGAVWFVSPMGVFIGPSAQIHVGAFVASGLNITNADFLAGNMSFMGGNGSVVNRGDILAEKVALIARQVINSGTINCPDGALVIAAGDKVYIGSEHSDVLVEIGTIDLLDTPDADYQADAAVYNDGAISAAGGEIVIAAAGDIFSHAIKNVGTITASVEMGDGGLVKLNGYDGIVSNTGFISAASGFGRGGSIIGLGGDFINSGVIDATGTTGGFINFDATRLGQFGQVLANGSAGTAGNISFYADEVIALGVDSLTSANAGIVGTGGEVIVYSPGAVLLRDGALISAKGGSTSGNGGFVELSGKQFVEFSGLVDTSAYFGEAGALLIDPAVLNITTFGAGVPAWADHGDGFWYDNTGQSILSPAAVLAQLLLQNVLLVADDTINVNEWINTGDAGFTAWNNTLKLQTLAATGKINILTNMINSGSGSIIFDSGSGGINVAATEISTGGDITFMDTAYFLHPITITPLDQLVDAGGKLEFQSDVIKGATSSLSGNDGTLTLGGNNGIVIDGTVNVKGSDIPQAAANLVIKDNFTASGDILARDNITFDKNGTLNGAGAAANQKIDAGDKLHAKGTITKTTAGDLNISGGNQIDLDKTVDVQNGSLTIEEDFTAGGDIKASGNITFEDLATFDGAGLIPGMAFDQAIEAGSALWAKKDVVKTKEGSLDITADGLITLDGSVDSKKGSLSITSNNNQIAANSFVNAYGNIEILGNGDVQLKQDVTSNTGGVSIISETGKVYTTGTQLTVNITAHKEGNNDEVDLPFIGDADEDPGTKGTAGIVIVASADLDVQGKLTDTRGVYNSAINDDRDGVRFLDDGDPIDIGIHVASLTGNTNVAGAAAIQPGGTIAIDAYDTVTFGSDFKNSLTLLSADNVLQVGSRITSDLPGAAAGKLPYASADSQAQSQANLVADVIGYPGSYVLRGGVLHPGDEPILGAPAPAPGPTPEPIPPAFMELEQYVPETILLPVGCPELLAWLRQELGAENEQIYLNNAFAQATDTDQSDQLCDSCQRLRDSVEIIQAGPDAAVADLIAAVSPLMDITAPPSAEQLVAVNAELARRDAAGNLVHANAVAWLEKGVEAYVRVLNRELGWDGDRAVAAAFEKYVDRLASSGNEGVAMLIMARMAEATR